MRFPTGPAAPWRPLLIERYLFARSMGSVAAALAVIASVIVLIDFVSVSRDVGVGQELSLVEVFALTMMKSPNVILLLLPFVFLFGVLGAFTQMNRRSELVALRAAGVSAWRFVTPAALGAFAVGLATVAALNPGAAWLYGRYEEISAELQHAGLQPKETWLRQGDGRTQVVIHAMGRRHGQLTGVSLFVYDADARGRLTFSRRIEAGGAVLHRGFWQLYNVREAEAGQRANVTPMLTIASNLDPKTVYEKYAAPQSTPFWKLPGAIRRLRAAGFSATGYRLRLHQLLAMPLLFAAMAVLGAAFSLRLMRLGGMAFLAASGVALGFGFFFLNALFDALGRADVIPPVLAGWAPPVLALLSALTLLAYTEDG